MNDKVTYREARSALLEVVRPVGTERVPLAACADRVLARELVATSDVPPFDRSPFDGYVLRAADSLGASKENPVTLRIMEEIPASCVPKHTLGAGQASKILTGAPIPLGGDAVIPFERTEFTASTVTLFKALRPGENIVRKGEDIRQGALLSPCGQRIDAGLMGSLAGQNIAEPLVYRRVRIGILSTGSELIELGHDLPLGKIHDTNRYSMAALVGGLGAEPVLYGSVPDNVEAIAEAMEQALSECDALITTGGVSVGDYDLTPRAMERIGARILVHGVDLKPGMACCYAVRDGKLLCGLSGNPASSITNFYVVALPALRRLCGRRDCETREFPVTLAERFGKPSPANRLLRGYSDFSSGTIKLRLSSGQGNVMISSLIACDLAAIVPAGSGPIEAGSILQGFFLDL